NPEETRPRRIGWTPVGLVDGDKTTREEDDFSPGVVQGFYIVSSFPYEKKKERKKSMCWEGQLVLNSIIIAANIKARIYSVEDQNKKGAQELMGETLETKNITHCWKGIKEDVQQTQ
ncbi:hypothetical protein ACJX0J_027975, partial [Zea mays]